MVNVVQDIEFLNLLYVDLSIETIYVELLFKQLMLLKSVQRISGIAFVPITSRAPACSRD